MTIDDLYSDEERTMKAHIDALMDTWLSLVKDKPVFGYRGKDFFCKDGFFPRYGSQKKKIVFIGRDPVEGMEKKGCIAAFFDEYQINKVANGERVDENCFHSRLLYLAQGILDDFSAQTYYELPSASEIARNLGKKKGISFAFMEFSKYADEDRLCKELVESFVQHSEIKHTHYFIKELEILEPDLILTMNLWEMPGIKNETVTELFESDAAPIRAAWHPEESKACLRELEIQSRKIPVIDLCHFSAKRWKNTEEDYYAPVREIIKHPEFRKRYAWD